MRWICWGLPKRRTFDSEIIQDWLENGAVWFQISYQCLLRRGGLALQTNNVLVLADCVSRGQQNSEMWRGKSFKYNKDTSENQRKKRYA